MAEWLARLTDMQDRPANMNQTSTPINNAASLANLQELVVEMFKKQVDQAMSQIGNSPGQAPAKSVKQINEVTDRHIKSPLDTTIYAPALRLTPNQAPTAQGNKDNAVQQVTQFIQDIRMRNHGESSVVDELSQVNAQATDGTNAGNSQPKPGTSVDVNSQMDKSREIATQVVIDTEKQKASLDGKQQGRAVYSDLVDDEFFHITCHINAELRQKIKAGQFVELEKLLVKEKHTTAHGDSHMSIYNKDGLAYFAPVVDRELKISNVRKWEQAFRVYAAIYSKANPHRSAEIWQYVYTINSAATSYHWSNVSEYDYTFRQLMGAYPDRSWAKTYLQGWNLSMQDPLNQTNESNSSKQQQEKDNTCWLFKKGKCHDPNCPRDHRCSYCGKWGHGLFNCRKLKKASGRSGNDNNHNDNSGRKSNPHHQHRREHDS